MNSRSRFSPSQLLIRLMNRWYAIVTAYVIIVTGSGLLYAHFEDKTKWDGVWWAFVTVLTVGYGDQYPSTIEGRMTAILMMHFGIMVVIPIIIGIMVREVLLDLNKFTDLEQRLMMARLKVQEAGQRIIVRNQVALAGKIDTVGVMLTKLGTAVGCDLRQELNDLFSHQVDVGDELEALWEWTAAIEADEEQETVLELC